MSIEQTDIVDIISTDRATGDVVLTISDHLDWSDSTAHQMLLQSGEILESLANDRQADHCRCSAVCAALFPDRNPRLFQALD